MEPDFPLVYMSIKLYASHHFSERRDEQKRPQHGAPWPVGECGAPGGCPGLFDVRSWETPLQKPPLTWTPPTLTSDPGYYPRTSHALSKKKNTTYSDWQLTSYFILKADICISVVS